MSIASDIKEEIEDRVMEEYSHDPCAFEAIMIDLACLFVSDYINDNAELKEKKEIESGNLALDFK